MILAVESSGVRKKLGRSNTISIIQLCITYGTGMIMLANSDPRSLYPVGITDNSPVVYCWDIECAHPDQSRRDDRKCVP